MDKVKHPADKAIAAAKEIVDRLRPFTLPTPAHMKADWPHPHLLAVAGSLRRRKDFVGDIEILFVPMTEKRKRDFFDEFDCDLCDEQIDRMVGMGALSKRPNVNGSETWGPKNKLAVHVASLIPVDLFATTIENWWVSLVIRTGSKETNLKLTTGAQKLGGNLNAYGSGVSWRDGSHTKAKNEKHVFELCGVKYLDPWKR